MSSEQSDRRTVRRWAEQEYEMYKRHGRPSRPYYMKCLRCMEVWEIGYELLDADHDARYHAGVHSGLYEEHAEIAITDSCGVEIFRVHAIYQPEQVPDGCPQCGSTEDSDRIACPDCGHIPEEDRLIPDGGPRRIGRDDLKECWCCGGLHDSIGTLCPDCDDAGCSRFGGECESDLAGSATTEGRHEG